MTSQHFFTLRRANGRHAPAGAAPGDTDIITSHVREIGQALANSSGPALRNGRSQRAVAQRHTRGEIRQVRWHENAGTAWQKAVQEAQGALFGQFHLPLQHTSARGRRARGGFQHPDGSSPAAASFSGPGVALVMGDAGQLRRNQTGLAARSMMLYAGKTAMPRGTRGVANRPLRTPSVYLAIYPETRRGSVSPRQCHHAHASAVSFHSRRHRSIH